MQRIRITSIGGHGAAVASARFLNADAWMEWMPNKTLMTPERLVGVGFRGWLAGYEYQDISCWECVWQSYAEAMGPQPAKRAVTELASWVREVRQCARRPIVTYPTGCAGFCRDECIAISVIAACQQGDCPALRACAYALIGSCHIDKMLEEATGFAHLLLENGQRLSPGVICNVVGVTEPVRCPLPH